MFVTGMTGTCRARRTLQGLPRRPGHGPESFSIIFIFISVCSCRVSETEEKMSVAKGVTEWQFRRRGGRLIRREANSTDEDWTGSKAGKSQGMNWEREKNFSEFTFEMW